MLFKLEKPSSIKKEGPFDNIRKVSETSNIVDVLNFIKRVSNEEYLYWDTFRYKEPSPKGVSKEELWNITKFIRQERRFETSIQDKRGKLFTLIKLDYFEKFLHDLDMNTGGNLFVRGGDVNKANKQKFISRGIMEEAIASSQLEGADTSREVAKKMLREGRKPRNTSEQMIVNNYTSMKVVEEKYKESPLTKDLIFELHSLITKDTVDSQGEKPRMRKKGEAIYISDKVTGLIYHEGPDIEFVKDELDKLIKFANNEGSDSKIFIHPVIKAIMLHFWMGYLHPFTDGNGRLARILFYWYLLKEGYWAFAYLPISKVIKKSPQQYIMAYVYTEQDDNDLTYFIDYNVKKINLAFREFSAYFEKQTKENAQMKKMSEIKYKLNNRQVSLLQFLYGDKDERTTLQAHMNVNQISKMTASNDLKDLVGKKFLLYKKQGRNVYYYGTDKIKDLFEK